MEYKLLPSLFLAAIPFAGVQAKTVEHDDSNATKKNVLFIAIDDLKPLLGCYGDPIAKTPNFDRLASKGTVFTHAYCQQAISGPSRASLLTGLNPDHTKVWDLKTYIRDINPDVVTLPQYFKQNGYYSAGIGKIYDPRTVDKKLDEKSWSDTFINHIPYLNKDYQQPLITYYQSDSLRQVAEKYRQEAIEQGIKRKGAINKYVRSRIKVSTECLDVPNDAYFDGAFAKGAIEFLKGYNKQKPFFFALGFKRPHLPFIAPKKFWDMYDRKDIPVAKYGKRALNSPAFAYHKSGELRSYSDIPDLISYNDIENSILPDYKAKELIHGYYACVSYVDFLLGQVLDTLEEEGLSKNTIIVLWGDHGWHLGDHGLWNKHTNFEQATKVPFIIVDPSAQPRRVSQPVEFVDIYPTLCKMCNLKTPSILDGKSILSLVKHGEDKKLANYAVSQYHRGPRMGYTFRTERYRYTVWIGWKNRVRNLKKVLGVELYDYKNDPLETKNYVNDPSYATVKNEMHQLWVNYAEKHLK